jgi:hypothetical protein
MIFGTDYPDKLKRLHLLGKFPIRKNRKFSTDLLTPELIEDYCKKLNIKVTYDEEFCKNFRKI